jgi:hypothetical protein
MIAVSNEVYFGGVRFTSNIPGSPVSFNLVKWDGSIGSPSGGHPRPTMAQPDDPNSAWVKAIAVALQPGRLCRRPVR